MIAGPREPSARRSSRNARVLSPLARLRALRRARALNPKYFFPLEADCKSGPNLGLAKKYKPPETMREAAAEARRLGLREALLKYPGRLNARSGLRDEGARR